MTSSGATRALILPWENGWTQFPVTVRNSNLLNGVYYQGRTYLSSVNNQYPAKFVKQSISKVVRFGAQFEGSPWNVAYGEQSNVYTCGDIFRDITNNSTSGIWQYEGTLLTPVTYCQ